MSFDFLVTTVVAAIRFTITGFEIAIIIAIHKLVAFGVEPAADNITLKLNPGSMAVIACRNSEAPDTTFADYIHSYSFITEGIAAIAY